MDRNSISLSSDVLRILFAMAEDSQVAIGVFNSAGEMVARVWNGSVRARQSYAILWDGRNDGGARVTSNVYVVRLVAAGVSRTAKVGVIR